MENIISLPHKSYNMDSEPRFNIVLLKEAEAFLSNLDYKTKDKIINNMDLARRSLNPILLKRLTGEVWEFRTQYNNIHYRLLAFWDKRENSNTLIIATHGFVKKVSKIPKKEIEKAEKIRNQYFN